MRSFDIRRVGQNNVRFSQKHALACLLLFFTLATCIHAADDDTIVKFVGNEITYNNGSKDVSRTASLNSNDTTRWNWGDNGTTDSLWGFGNSYTLFGGVFVKGSAARYTRLDDAANEFVSYLDGSAGMSNGIYHLLWTKNSFINGYSNKTVAFNSNSVLKIRAERNGDSRNFRWVIKNGSTYYMSEFLESTASGGGVKTWVTLSNFNNSATVGNRWGIISPTSSSFGIPSLPTFNAVNFTDVQAVGFIYEVTRSSNGHNFTFDSLIVYASSSDAENYATWTGNKTLYLNTSASGASVSSNVTNFPVLIRLNPSNFPNFASTNVGGSDIRFSKTDGTHLDYEIERWSDGVSNNDTAEIWVRVDTILGSRSNQIKMYWGNGSATTKSNSAGVFRRSRGFVSVFHLTNDVADKVSGFTSTNNGTTDYQGIIGRARDFGGSTQCIDVTSNHALDVASNLTVSAWGYADTWGNGNERILQKGEDNQYKLGDEGDILDFELWGAGGTSGGLPLVASWHHFAGTYDGANARLYVDGTQAGSTPSTGAISAGSNQYLTIGNKPNSGAAGDHFDGRIDEVRVCDQARSADWIKLEVANQKQVQTLVEYIYEDYSTWGSNVTISLNTTSSGANISSDVYGYPVLLRLNTATFTGFASTLANGADIRFAKTDGTRLGYEIERWVDGASNNDTADIWVLLDTVYGNNSTQSFKMYYNKAAVTTTSNSNTVFNTLNGFAAVYHLNNSVSDATLNNFNGTDNATTNTAGIVGNAKAFNGSSSYIGLTIPNYTNSFTYTAWIKTNAVASIDNRTALSLSEDRYMILHTKSDLKIRNCCAGNFYDTDTNLTANKWFLAGSTWNGTSNGMYVNGTLTKTDGTGVGYLSTSGAIGKNVFVNGEFFQGYIDEVRIENVGRSASWMKLSYENQKVDQKLIKMYAEDYSTWSNSTSWYLNTLASGSTITGNVYNFPVLVRLNPATFSGFATTQPGGTDIRFEKTDGTHLAYEIERWVDGASNNDTAEIWVKVDTVVPGSGSQSFKMYYGKSGVASQSSSKDVFTGTNGYWMDYHLSGNVNDASSNLRSGTDHGSVDADGIVGKGRSLNGTSQYIKFPNWTVGNEFSFSIWFNPSSLVNTDQSVFGPQSDRGTIEIVKKDSIVIRHCCAGAWTDYPYGYSGTRATTGNWYNVVSTWNGSVAKMYLNGTLVSTGDHTVESGGDSGAIGARSVYWDHLFNGKVDEAYIADEVRSPDWIKLAYDNQKLNQNVVYNAAVVSAKNIWNGGGADSSWGTAGNWSLGKVPTVIDTAVFNNTSSKGCYLDGTRFVGVISFTSGYTGSFRCTDRVASGLRGTYYDKNDFTGFNQSRIDTTVNFDWASNAPYTGTSVDFNTRWTGEIKPSYSQPYTFYVSSDDGARLWVNNQLIIDDWNGHLATEHSGTIALTANTRVPIVLEYYDGSGGAVCQLSWSSSSTPKAIVPKSALFCPETLYVSGSADFQTGGNFNGGTGTICLINTVAQNLTPHASATLPWIVQSGAGGTTLQTNDLTSVGLTLLNGSFNTNAGTPKNVNATYLYVNGGQLVANSSTFNLTGDCIITDTNATIFSKGTSTVNLTGSGILANQSGNNRFYNLSIASSGKVVTFANDLYVHNNLVFNGGDAGGNWAKTLKWAGAGTLTINSATQMTFGTLEILSEVATQTVPSFAGYPNLKLNRCIDGTTAYTIGTGGLTCGNLFLSAYLNVNNIHVTVNLNNQPITASKFIVGDYGWSDDVDVTFGSAALTVNGDVNMNAPSNHSNSVNLGTGSITVSGNWINNGVPITQGTSTVTFNGTGVQTVNNNSSLYNVTVNKTTGSLGTIQNRLKATGTLTLTNGTLDLGAGLIDTVGAFVLNGGVLDFNDTSATLVSAGAITINNGNSSTIANLGGARIKASGNIALNGLNASTPLTINPSFVWLVSAVGTLTASYARVQNSDASGGSAGSMASNCIDDGGNINWSGGGEDYGTWKYNRRIQINTSSTGANITTGVKNFPLLVRLTGGANIDFAQAKQDGSDVRFANASGAHLSYEIERWCYSCVPESAEVWVKVDTIAPQNSTQYITMYWGKATGVDKSISTAVFDTGNGFRAVWHLSQDPGATAPQFTDGCIIGNNGINQGAIPRSGSMPGNIGNALMLDGSSQYISTNTQIINSQNFTISGWFKTSTTTGGEILGYGGTQVGASGAYDRRIWMSNTGTLNFGIFNSTRNIVSSPSSYNDNSWHYFAGKMSSAGVSLFVDGTSVASNATYTAAEVYNGWWKIGYESLGTWAPIPTSAYFSGTVDEFRYDTVARSDDWIKMCYENQKPGSSIADVEDYSKWANSRKIFLNTTSSGAKVNSNQTNFPVLIRLNPSTFDGFSSTLAGGADIRFTKSNGTPLSYEIERWVDKTGDLDTAEVWVKVDTVFGNNSSQYITMYYGKNGCTSKSNSAAVFDTGNGFAGVWHLNEDPSAGAGSIKDRTSNSNNGTPTNLANSNSINGLIGKAIDFNTATQKIDCGNGASLNVSNLTLSAWSYYNSASYGILTGLIGKEGGASNIADYELSTNNSGLYRSYIGTNQWNTNTSIPKQVWSYVSLSYNGSMRKFFYNGAATDSLALTTTFTNSYNFLIGKNWDVSFPGYIDEVRVEKVVRSSDWIKLCYENQKSAQTLVEMSENYSLWPSSKKIVLNTTGSGAAVTTNQIGFPILVHLDPGNFDGFANTLSSGADIRFAKSDGTHLSFEIERWVDNGSNFDTAEIWVRVDTAFGNNNTQSFTMYYGKSGVTSKSNGASVFRAGDGFLGVWHLGDDGSTTAGGYKDATGVNDGQGVNMTSSSDVKGQMGICSRFQPSSSQYITIPNESYFDSPDTVTFSAWARVSGWNSAWQAMVAKGDGNYVLCRDGTTDYVTPEILRTDGWIVPNTNTAVNDSSWFLLAATYDRTNFKVYHNGALSSTFSSTTQMSVNNTQLSIGENIALNGRYWNGYIDEVRIERKARSADWVKLCYENQKTGQTLVDIYEDYSKWNYSKRITLNTKSWAANVANNVTGFPVLIRLTPDNFGASNFTNTLAGGADIRFAKSDGTHLNYQIERWFDEASNRDTAEIWVKLDTVYGNNGNQYIKMFWGKSYSADHSQSSMVFDTNYCGVWHLSEDAAGIGASGLYKDASRNANNGIDSVSSIVKTGIIGYGQDFTGVNNVINVPNSSSLNLGSSNSTISLWLKTSQVPAALPYAHIISKYEGSPRTGFEWSFQNSGRPGISYFNFSSNGTILGKEMTKTINDNNWHYLTGSRTGNKLVIYLDGQFNDSITNAIGSISNTIPLRIGNYAYGDAGGDFDGSLDEIEISKTARNADWVKLCYENQKSNQTLVDIEDYSEWAYSQNIIVNTAGITTSTLTDFPLLVRLDPGIFGGFASTNASGSEIRFAKPDGTHLAYEIERWTDGTLNNDTAAIWVRLDTVKSNNSSQYVKMYWGNTASTATSKSNGAVVFDSSAGFVAVYHLNETGNTTAGGFLDATKQYNATGVGLTNATTVSANVGLGQQFNGTSQDLAIPVGATSGLSNFSFQMWLKTTESRTVADYLVYPTIFGTCTNGLGSDEFALVSNGGKLAFWSGLNGTNDQFWVSNQSLNDNTWRLITVASDGSTIKLYHNNSYLSSGNDLVSDGSSLVAHRFGFGAQFTESNVDGRWHQGVYDELQISKVARSADWIKLCYETQKTSPTAISMDPVDYQPLRIKHNLTTGGTSDSLLIYTRNWTLVFDEDSGLGGKWLSPDSACKGNNQLVPGKNLFQIIYNGNNTADTDTSSNKKGKITLLTSDSTLVQFMDTVVVSGQSFTNYYTVYGSGRMHVRVEAVASGAVSAKTLGFQVSHRKNGSGTFKVRPQSGNATSATHMLLSSDSLNSNDILFVPYNNWAKATAGAGGIDTITSTTTMLAGYRSSGSYALASGEAEVWEYTIDFSHRTWNDSSSQVTSTAADYRNPDTLKFITGTAAFEKAWEYNLVGHWKFDEGTNDTAFDNSGNRRNAKVTAGCTWAAGKWSGGLTSTANDSVWTGTNSLYDNKAFTLMGWVNAASLQTTAILIGKYNNATSKGFKLAGTGSNQLVLTVDGATITNLTTVNSAWKHVAVTYHELKKEARFYVDGVLDTIVSISGTPTYTYNSANVVIGKGLVGSIDDVRFYGNNLSDMEIKTVYQVGYNSSYGNYHVRADNNNTVHFTIKGNQVKRNFPVIRMSNYWATTLPAPGCVTINGSALTKGVDYFAYLDDPKNELILGVNRIITDSVRIYIDDTYPGGSRAVTAMKKMSWGVTSLLGKNYVCAKNLSTSSFDSPGSNQFYFCWKMDNVDNPNDMNGELWRYKSSEITGSSPDTSSTNNLVFINSNRSPLGNTMHSHKPGVPEYGLNSANAVNAVPTFTIAESSSVRIILKLNSRTLSNTETEVVATYFTVYPTGQIFRSDSISAMSSNVYKVWFTAATLTDTNRSIYLNTNRNRGGWYGGSTIQDEVYSFLGLRNSSGFKSSPWLTSDHPKQSAGAGVTMLEFLEDGNSNPDFAVAKLPIQTSFYMDVQRDGMTPSYMDSVSNGVQFVNTPNMIVGSVVRNSVGDLDTNGFNEREGAYIFQANNNTVDFKLYARKDTCRFNPAFRVTNYFASQKPQYLFKINKQDTTQLIEDYDYNMYHNKTSKEIVFQVNSVICDTTEFYLSSDKTLAVFMSNFYASSGDSKDTLLWKTESEQANLGFYLYRRVKPDFLDSVIIGVDSLHINDSVMTNAHALYKEKKLSIADTQWVHVNEKIIPGAPQGASFGTRLYKYIDYTVKNDVLYEYKLVAVDYESHQEYYGPINIMPKAILPVRFALLQNYPNPFRNATTVRFELPIRTRLSLNIYDLQGRLVRILIAPDRRYNPGFYSITWDGKNDYGRRTASTMYVYRLSSPRFAKARAMILAR